MVNKSTKTNNHLSPQLDEHKNNNDIFIANTGPGLG